LANQDFRVKNGLQVGLGASVVGIVTAESFTGSGIGLTSVPSESLTGTISSERLSGTYNIDITGTMSGDSINVGTGNTGVFANNDGTLLVTGIATFKDRVIFDSTNSIQVPVGTDAEKDAVGTAVTGQIRYNTTNSQFEGFGPGNDWGSLGGVKDVDGDTYVKPESSPGSDEDALTFFTGGTERAVIDSDGKVGIGTTNPTATLDLDGDLNVSGISTFQNNVEIHSTGYLQIPVGLSTDRPTGTGVTLGQIRYNSELSQFEGYGAGNAWGSLGGIKDVDQDTYITAESSAGADEDALTFFTGGTERAVIDSNGKVGIATTNPTATLDVNGTLNVSGVSTFNKISVGNTTGTNYQYLRSTGDGLAWDTFPVVRTGFSTIATAGQTGFSTSYNVGFIDVYVNGIRLTDSEFTANDGTNIGLSTACFGGEYVDIIAYSTISTGSGGGGVGGGSLTIQDEGTPLTSVASILNFVGAGVTATGSGATKTITINGGGGSGGSSYTNSDVDNHLNVSTASSTQVLSWDGSDYDWIDQSAGGGGGASTLDGLSDVTIGTLADNQLLQYNSTNSQWENISAATVVGAASSFATKSATATTATAGQTTFNGTYTVGFVDVYLNGVKLSEDQYTSTTGTNIVLDEGASENDIVEVVGLTANVPASGGGGGSSATRSSETLTIGSISSGVTTTGTITLPKTGVMISIHPVGDASGWLRLYTRSDLAAADASRARTQDPDSGSGVILETITSGISTVYLSPQTIFANAEDTPINTFNYRFTKDGTAGITTFTFKYLSLES